MRPVPDLQNYILKIELDERVFVRRSPMIEAERSAAVRDILGGNLFRIPDQTRGPYYVRIGLDAHRLVLRVRDCMRHDLADIALSLSPFRKLIKDYFLICESYQMAHSSGDVARLEVIDMARRGLHDEGAAILRERLAHAVETDHTTARGIFTLLCVLHIGAVQPW